MLSYKKPAFWLAAAAIIIALAVGVSLLANPQDTRQPYVPAATETLPQGIAVQAESAGYPAGANEIKLIVRNQSNETIQYGSRYAIEQYDEKQGIWYQVPFDKNAAFDGLLHLLKAQDTDSFFIYLSMLRNKPGAGRYRVWLLDDRITCEFELTNEPLAKTALLPEDITIVAWADGQVLQGQVISETQQKQIVMDAVQAYSLQSTGYPALSLEEMGNYISIHLKNLDPYAEDFYVFNLDGQNYLQYGLAGRYSQIDGKIYDSLIGKVMGYAGLIGSGGLPLSLTMTIQSGENTALAMAHQITIQEKQTGKTENLAPMTPQSIAGKLQYLTIDRSAEQDTPFTPYVNGQKVYGMYTLYDNELNKVPFLMPSGLAPQTYIFHDAKPGQYIVGLTTGFETKDSSVTCQYFFGVTLPEPAPNGTETTMTPSTADQIDIVSGYLFVADYLATERDIGNLPLKYLAVDTTQLVGLSAGDKTRFLKELEQYHLEILDKTKAELTAEGYIKGSSYEFVDGALITMNKISIKGPIITMDAFIYFAGLNGSGLADFDITYDGGGWSITRIKYRTQS